MSRCPGTKTTVPEWLKIKAEKTELGNPTCELHLTASKKGDDDPLSFIQPVFLFAWLFVCFLLGTVQGSQHHNGNKATWVPRLLELAM